MRERDRRRKGGRIIQKVNSIKNDILTQKRGIANFLVVDKSLKMGYLTINGQWTY